MFSIEFRGIFKCLERIHLLWWQTHSYHWGRKACQNTVIKINNFPPRDRQNTFSHQSRPNPFLHQCVGPKKFRIFYHFLEILDLFRGGKFLFLTTVSSIYPHKTKECVAVLIVLYKKNVAVSCVGIDFLLIRPFYLARTRLVEVRFAWNKKEYFSLLNHGIYVKL